MNVQQIAIIVIGRNEGKRLKKCLHSVVKSNAMVVYIDSDSTDGSVEFADSLGVKTISLNTTKRINAAIARNAGINWVLANADDVEYIHFIDGDCELAEGWLEIAIDNLEKNSDVAAVCGRLREKDVHRSIYTRICDMDWYIKPGEIDSCGGIATVKKAIIMDLKGFNETLIAGEEPEFYGRVRAKNFKVLCLNSFMGSHDSDMMYFQQWWTRTVKTGFGFANGAQWGKWQDRQRSIVVWAAIIPLIIITLSIIHPIMLFLLIVYPLQVLRIAAKLTIPYSFSDKLLNGLFCILVKVPQFIGMMKFHFGNNRSLKNDDMEYKS